MPPWLTSPIVLNPLKASDYRAFSEQELDVFNMDLVVRHKKTHYIYREIVWRMCKERGINAQECWDRSRRDLPMSPPQ